jgi:hypothetical protein
MRKDDLNSAIELHDSEVGSLARDNHSVIVRLTPAYIHKSAGDPGWDEGIGEVQDCTMTFDQGHVEGEIGELPSVILDGDLQVGAQAHPNMIHLPCRITGEAVTLTLFLDPDYRKLVVSGSALSAILDGEPEYVEEFRSRR